MSMRDVVLCLASCFDDVVLCFAVVLCFDDVVLCFARRRTSCFEDAICFSLAIWVALRDAVLCSVTAKYAASVSQFPCFLSVFAFAPSPSLSLGGGPCLSLPFLVPFSQGDHRRQQEGPGLRLRAFDVPSSTCFWWRCKPSNRKILRASRRFVLPAL